jgi:cell wall-associated NlpC family hydrolase
MIAPAGAVAMQHLSPLESRAPDFTRIAESFLGTPYLWGGKTSLGIDCSGLVQVALSASGLAAPRDSDLQEAEIGLVLLLDSGIPPLQRGDLVFWPGHVGMMRDGEMLLHANSHHMAVASEPLDVARKRIRARGVEITSIRRLPER